MSDYLVELENLPELEGSIIRATKIHKVLKAMIKLPSIPLDEDFQFQSRSINLLAKWNEILTNDPNAGPVSEKANNCKPDTISATTNGSSKEVEHEAENAGVGEAAAPEEESKEALENKIGTTVEGEKEAEKASEPMSANEANKAIESEMQLDENAADEPNIEDAPEKEYKPPGETLEATG